MQKKFLALSDLHAYKNAFALSNTVWSIVLRWKIFAQDTIGKQFVRSIDSIAANIAEGFGRYGKKDKIHFYRYAYGSVMESIDWLEKAKVRKLMTNDEYLTIKKNLEELPKQIHILIKFTETKLTI